MELTRRELDVLKFLSSGYTNEQIANVLGVHYRAIANYLDSIWRKLDVENKSVTVARTTKREVVFD